MDNTTLALFMYCSVNLALTVGVLSDSAERPSWAAIVGSLCFGTPLLILFCVAMASQKISSMLQEI